MSFTTSTKVKTQDIDRVKVFLKWETARDMGACREALDYWTKKYNKAPLEITDSLLREFDRVILDGSFDHSTGKPISIDVRTWVQDNSWWSEEVGVWYDFEIENMRTFADVARWLKVILLVRGGNRTAKQLYVKIGGKIPAKENWP